MGSRGHYSEEMDLIHYHLHHLFFTAGGLVGLGLGIIYLPKMDCITQYFDKWRPLVTGITICGSGLGTFIMAPLTQM